MNFRTSLIAGLAVTALAACGKTETAAAPDAGATETVANAAVETETAVENGAVSGVYTPDPNHRYIAFTYNHQGYSKPILTWDGWTGELNFNADDPAASTVSVTIDATSLDTGVPVFDGHMAGENLFDTANYPQITFVSTSVTRTGPTTADIAGDLTIKGVTKPATVKATFNKGAFEERANAYKIGFSGVAQVKRSDFGITYAVPFVSDEVDIMIETEWMMPAAAE